MRAWSLVPAGFGLLWLALGLHSVSRLTKGSEAALLVGALLVVLMVIVRKRDTARRFDRKAFYLGLIVEGAGITMVLVACNLLQSPSAIVPLIGAVVGWHFFPLAKAFGDRMFIVAGCLMSAVSLAALFWLPPWREAVAGIGGGAILWAFTLARI